MDLKILHLSFWLNFLSLYLLNMLMDRVDTLHGGRCWSEVSCCIITTHLGDLQVKVTDLEILCFWLKYFSNPQGLLAISLYLPPYFNSCSPCFPLYMLHVGTYTIYFRIMIYLISCLYLCINEPLQKLRARLGSCKIGLRAPVTLCY